MLMGHIGVTTAADTAEAPVCTAVIWLMQITQFIASARHAHIKACSIVTGCVFTAQRQPSVMPLNRSVDRFGESALTLMREHH